MRNPRYFRGVAIDKSGPHAPVPDSHSVRIHSAGREDRSLALELDVSILGLIETA